MGYYADQRRDPMPINSVIHLTQDCDKVSHYKLETANVGGSKHTNVLRTSELSALELCGI